MILDADRRHLAKEGLNYLEATEAGFQCIVLQSFTLPPGFDPGRADMLLRLPPGFPDAAPDMWWCDPPVRVAATGKFPVAAEVMEPHLGRTWQRFSRHLRPGQWKPGNSGLATFLAIIRQDLAKTVGTTL